MKNYVKEGKVLKHVLAADLDSGAALVIGDSVLINSGSGTKSGEETEMVAEGVVNYARLAATAMVLGQVCYYDAGNDWVTDVDGGGANKKMGIVAEDSPSADSEIKVKLER